MTQSRTEAPPSRIELVVLACLSQRTPPNDEKLGEALHELALPGETAESARRQAIDTFAALVRRAWVTSDDVPVRSGKRKATQSRKLTASGKRVLSSAFHLTDVPTWAQARDQHFPAMALGLSPGSDAASEACTETALVTAVLRKRFVVRDAATPAAVCDALIASKLGISLGNGAKLTLDRIRAHVLLRGIDAQAHDAPSPQLPGYLTKLAAWIASSAVGADDGKRKMGRALARRWVCGEPNPLGTASIVSTSEPVAITPVAVTPLVPSTPTGNVAVAPDPKLLEVVRETIPRVGAEGRFGEKVYVSAIWRSIDRDHKAGELSLDHFKRWLLRANRDGWLVLARADLVGAMDVKQVNESEISDRGATFHFVLDQRNGTSGAQRESHAG